ncbi:MFS transporter [Methylophaga sp. OBS4]|uniref:MFS transporter n=1 Tax=Methylophaga sp. OBS4 TaxID=2991935 RepID=UPI00225A20CA|nr:MFS transporter [Methylophaga sp. OBS4]MCX4187667.1 MFS transporter [Methylophaga sp. OBS4]
MTRQRASKKEILGWAMFDFANQSYTLLIITVIFGDLFTRLIVGDAENNYRLGNLLWSLSLATGYLLVVITAPFLGAVMDLSARRKQFLFISYLVTVITTTLLYFVAPGYILLGMLLIVVSNYAYSIGESFIASFLPDLGPAKDLGRISGFGWALGYVGGLVATGIALLFLGEVSADNFDNVRWVGPFAAAFFLLAAIPTFLWLKENGTPHPVGQADMWQQGLKRVRSSLTYLTDYHDLRIFLLSALFAMSGIYIIIAFTFIYGAQVIGWDERMRVLTFITVQVTATAGAILFGWIQDRMGSRFTYGFTLLFWILAILLIWQTPQLTAWLNQFGHELQMQDVFIVVAVAAGLCLGATQSASRAIVGQLTPLARAAEFFGFWGLSHKLAAIIGLVGVGLMQAWVGLQNAILLCALFFALAFIVCLKVNFPRGQAVAERYREDSQPH